MVSFLRNSFGSFTLIFVVKRLSRHNRIDKHRQKVRWAHSIISLTNGVTCTAAAHCLAFGILSGGTSHACNSLGDALESVSSAGGWTLA